MSRLLDRHHVMVSGFNRHQSAIYLMTKSFRVHNNYGLYQSIQYAKKHGSRLKILVLEPYELSERNRLFFLKYVDDLLEKLSVYSTHVRYIVREEFDVKCLSEAHIIFMDQPYLNFDLTIFKQVKMFCLKSDTILMTIESNVCVPVLNVSDKAEYQARTFRPKIKHYLDEFTETVLNDAWWTKAEKEAWELYQHFKHSKLEAYDKRNDPSKGIQSFLSPMLKYGFISPVLIYLDLKERTDDSTLAFLEELIVRRELAYNYVYYQAYDRFDTMTDNWAYKTMKLHECDQREYLYSMDDYLHFNTHDPYFNASMIEMVFLGRMHPYMRMYWCKKIIEWSRTYQEAYEISINLNNTYFYDGLTPNGYAGVAWCFGKHDRAWFERPIFGQLRYMNDRGLKRKFDIETYVKQMNQIKEEGIYGI